MGGMTFSTAQTSAKAGGGERYLPKRVGLAAKIETSKEVSPHDFLAPVLNGGKIADYREEYAGEGHVSIQKAKKPKGDFVAYSGLYAVCHGIAVLDVLYLLEALALAA